jgi:hypothetical protein
MTPMAQPQTGFQEINDPTLVGQTSVQGGLADKVLGIGKKVGGFIGRATGLAGYGKGVTDAARIGVSDIERRSADKANAEADLLIQQAKRLPVGNPQRKQLLAQAQQILSGAEQSTQSALGRLDKVTTTPKQMLGSTVKLGTTVGGFAFGAPATALGRVGMGAATGGVFGAADAMEKNLGTEDILKSAGIGAVTGGATAGLIEGVRWAASNFPTRLWGSKAGFTNKQMTTKQAQEALKYAVKSGKAGTRSGLIRESNRIIGQLDDQIDDALTTAKGTVRLTKVAQEIADDLNTKGWNVSASDILGRIDDLAPNAKGLIKRNMTYAELNQLRGAVDDALGSSIWMTQQPKPMQQLAMAIRGGIANSVKSGVPQTREWFSQMAKEITLRNALQNLAAKQGNNLPISLMDLIAAGAGASAAGGLGGVASAVGYKVGTSTPVVTGAAVLLDRLGPIISKLAPQEQQAVNQAILDAYGPQQQ